MDQPKSWYDKIVSRVVETLPLPPVIPPDDFLSDFVDSLDDSEEIWSDHHGAMDTMSVRYGPLAMWSPPCGSTRKGRTCAYFGPHIGPHEDMGYRWFDVVPGDDS